MANPNKDKGDRAEAAVRDYLTEHFPGTWRTRAGWDDDRGDVVLDLLGDRRATIGVQVKDTAARPGTPVMKALDEQVEAGEHLAGVIWWKLRGKGHPRDWHVVMTGQAYVELMQAMAVLMAGRAAGGLTDGGRG